MTSIATLTMNPAIDGSSEADRVRHTHKIRTHNEAFHPGGGGINVARVLARLGADVTAIFLAGGVTGSVLDGLLERISLNRQSIAIEGDTRISLSVLEGGTGKEYRFVPEGPVVTDAELQACLDLLGTQTFDWLVLSGSLPRGAPDDFYATIVGVVKPHGTRVVVDSSGPGLRAALDHGGIHLVKPSRGEMEQYAGCMPGDREGLIAAARTLVDGDKAEIVAISMGHEGAILVDAASVLALPAIDVEVRSAVGAGDSFVGAMTYGLSLGRSHEEAFRLGVAAGTAAVTTPGTDLCHRADVLRLAASLGLSGLEARG